ncbi:unnamed protein product, partial [marine sediment metagenome]
MVRSLFYNYPFVKDNDLVSILYGGETMSYNEGCPILQEFFQRILNEKFCLRVNAGSGLIQDENPGIKGQSPGKSQKLPLPLRESGASFLDF